MNISALQSAGPLLDLTTAARSLSAGAGVDRREPDDTFQKSLTSVPADSSLSTATPYLSANKDSLEILLNSGLAGGQTTSTSTEFGSTKTSAAASLLSELKNYTTGTSQESSQAYQEYAKAWGGRIVHGEVEFPPLSIYLE